MADEGMEFGGQTVPPITIPGQDAPVYMIACAPCDGDIEPAFEDSADCRCATRRLCDFVDDDGEQIAWYELCEQDGLCKWRPMIDVLLANADADQTQTICDWFVDNCGDSLTTLIQTIISTTLATFKTSLFDTQTYTAGDTPDCSDGAGCVTWFVPDDSVTDGCPDGVATHVCVDGTLICLGGADGGAGPGGGDVEITASGYGPWTLSFSPFTSTCDPATANGTMTAPEISTSSTGFCDDDVASGTFPTPSDILNEYHTVVVTAATDLEICFDMQGEAGNLMSALLLDASGNPVPFTSATGPTSSTAVAASTSACSGQAGADFSLGAPGGGNVTENICFTINGVAPGTYTFVIAAIRGAPPRCTTNLTATGI